MGFFANLIAIEVLDRICTEDGREQGQAEGYAEGYREGQAEGYALGKADGYQIGKADGFKEMSDHYMSELAIVTCGYCNSLTFGRAGFCAWCGRWIKK